MEYEKKELNNEKLLTKNEKSKNFESFFIWLDLSNEVIKEDYTPRVEEDEIPTLKLMRLAIDVFFQVKVKNITTEEILKSFENCDKQMKLVELNRPEQFSVSVVKHVLETTKYFAFLELDMKTEAEKIYRKIEIFELHRGTLNGLKSIFWFKFYRYGHDKSTEFAKKAIEEAPRCDLWHFILGKSLRRIRRDAFFASKPSRAEIDAFETAYNISKNVLYGLFAAESSGFPKSEKLYEELYRTVTRQRDTHIIFLLKLAIGFIRSRKLLLAEDCLNRVEGETPRDRMLLHYKGILCIKKKNYHVAAEYMKEAAAEGNLCAARQYVQCMQFLELHGFDPAEYLTTYVKELEKNAKNDVVMLQHLYLDIAHSHMIKMRKTNAFEYYLKAIEINPESEVLTRYYTCVCKYGDSQNIYEVLENFFNTTDSYDCGSVSSDVQKLKEYCKKYFLRKKMIDDMSELKL